MEILFLPFVFYILWGPFVVPYFIRSTIKELKSQNCYNNAEVIQRTFIMTTTIFLPVLAGSGGDIPVVYPWWLGVITWFMDGKGDFYRVLFSFFPAVFVVPSTWFYITREVA